jgi:hypothetical protein
MFLRKVGKLLQDRTVTQPPELNVKQLCGSV